MRSPQHTSDTAELRDDLRRLAASVAKLISASESETEQGSWTLKQFRERHQLSESQFFKLLRDGEGPEVMLVGSVGKRISREAEAAWIQAREAAAREKAPTKAEAADKAPAPPAQPKLGEPAQVAPGFGKAPHLGRRSAAQPTPEPRPASSHRKRKRDSAAVAE